MHIIYVLHVCVRGGCFHATAHLIEVKGQPQVSVRPYLPTVSCYSLPFIKLAHTSGGGVLSVSSFFPQGCCDCRHPLTPPPHTHTAAGFLHGRWVFELKSPWMTNTSMHWDISLAPQDPFAWDIWFGNRVFKFLLCVWQRWSDEQRRQAFPFGVS